MAITIRQIAVVAGVSRGTVDRVLHNRSGVKPEIAEHVRNIAKELGFEPNRAGKLLASRKQPLQIGCFLPCEGNAFFDDVIKGLLTAEAEHSDFGVSLLLEKARGYDADEHIAAIRRLLDAGCAALCVSTIDTARIRTFIDEIIASGIPVVTINTDLTKTKRLCYIGCDYLSGGNTAAGLLSLVSRKRCNLLIVTGSLKIKGHNERVQGFAQTLRKKKIDYRLIDIFESLDDDDHAYQMTLQTLRACPEVDCVYIAAAGVAGVCRAIVELGREKDLFVLSFDATPSTLQLLREGVIDFTICQQPEEQGYHAVRILFDYFMSGKTEAPQNHITQTVIKIRENCGCEEDLA